MTENLTTGLITAAYDAQMACYDANAAEPYSHDVYAAADARRQRIVDMLADGDDQLAGKFGDALFDITHEGADSAVRAFNAIRAELLDSRAAAVCDCLTGHVWGDDSLDHYSGCAAASQAITVGGATVDLDLDATDERCLAELASFRDIDAAIYALRAIRRRASDTQARATAILTEAAMANAYAAAAAQGRNATDADVLDAVAALDATRGLHADAAALAALLGAK